MHKLNTISFRIVYSYNKFFLIQLTLSVQISFPSVVSLPPPDSFWMYLFFLRSSHYHQVIAFVSLHFYLGDIISHMLMCCSVITPCVCVSVELWNCSSVWFFFVRKGLMIRHNKAFISEEFDLVFGSYFFLDFSRFAFVVFLCVRSFFLLCVVDFLSQQLSFNLQLQ